MAPRTRKTATDAAPAEETQVDAVAEEETVADEAPFAAPAEETQVDAVAEEETVADEAPFVAPAPEAGVDYFADMAFTAQLDAQLVSFAPGEKLDPIAGAYLAAAGAPVSTQARPD
jgi:hypothetical protein